MLPPLVIGTHNAGKFAEMSRLLADVPAKLGPLDAAVKEADETGTTFGENAAIKAAAYAVAMQRYALADDSGLEVEALDGRPGVLSARYAGVDTPFPRKIEFLLTDMQNSRNSSRRARFVCSLAFAAPDGEIVQAATGVCEGTIAQKPRGTGGFGYDPIFIPDGHSRSFAELSDAEKGAISHRGRAFCEIIPFLRDFFAKLT